MTSKLRNYPALAFAVGTLLACAPIAQSAASFDFWQRDPVFQASPAAPLTRQGDVAARGMNDEEGVRKYTLALRLDPKFMPALRNRGKLYAALGKYKEALADLTAAMNGPIPINSVPLRDRAELYLALHRYTEAETDLDKLIKQNATDGLLSDLAQCHVAAKQYDKAIAEYTRALKITPQPYYVICKRAQAYYLAKQYDKALADCNGILSQAGSGEAAVKNNMDIYQLRAKIYTIQGKKDLAAKDIKSARERDKSNMDTVPFMTNFGKNQ